MRPTTATILIIAALLLPVSSAQGQPARQYTEIAGTGQTLFKLAIPPVLDGGASGKQAKVIREVMTRDMVLIGLFKIIDPKSYLADLHREGTGIKTEVWGNIGAQGVIKAKATMMARELNVEFYLYDLGKGPIPVLKKTYKGPSKSVRRLAHKFGDDVVKYYTGERGIFTTKIVFATTKPKSRLSHIYVMDYDGHGVYKVSRTGKQNVLPAWSPRGVIAYTSYLWRNTDLFVMPAGGGRAKRISKYSGLNTGAAYHPSGNSIALTLSRDGNAEIYIISATGKIQRRLTKNEAIDTSPTWSPDGSKIAFVSNRGGTPQIYVVGSGGGAARRLTFQGNYNQEPSWCPRKDRPLVAFTGRDEKGSYDIYTINVKNGELKRLTQGQGSNKSPTWAPSGRLIAFSSSRGGVWLMNEDGLNQHRVYRGGAQTPDWSK